MNMCSHLKKNHYTEQNCFDPKIGAWELENPFDILQNASLGIHFVGSDATILWANEAEMKLLGYESNEYIGHKVNEFHACEETIQDILDRLSRNETLSNYEAVLKAKDGSLRYVQINSNVFFKQGKFIHTRCFTRDITSLKQVQMQLWNEQQERIQVAEMYKSQQNAFIDTVCHELRNPLNGILGAVDLLKEQISHLQKVLQSLQQSPNLLSSKDCGSTLGIKSCSASVYSNLTTFKSSSPTSSNVTDVNTNIFHSDLSSQRIPIIGIDNASHNHCKCSLNPLLQDIESSIQSISLCASHQKAIIDDVLDLSRLESFDFPLIPVVFSPQVIIQECILLFQSLLHEKRIKLYTVFAGHQQQGDFQTECLHEDIVQSQSEGKASVEEDLPFSSVLISADVNRFKQIVINLLSNAVKFSEKGTKIVIRAYVEASDSRSAIPNTSLGTTSISYRLHVEVSDSGMGLTDDEINLLFKKFCQIKSKQNHNYTEGSGLGLSISKQLVEKMGGSIEARSKKGKGSTFKFWIPIENVLQKEECPLNHMKEFSLLDTQLADKSKSYQETEKKIDSISSNSQHCIPCHIHCICHTNEVIHPDISQGTLHLEPEAKKKRQQNILIVEDNIINQKILVRALAQNNLQCETVSDGNECIQLLFSMKDAKYDQFSLILMDIELGTTNGIETAKKIREEEQKRKCKRMIPIICVSGYTRSEYKELAMCAGMNDYITKPYKFKELQEKIEKWQN